MAKRTKNVRISQGKKLCDAKKQHNWSENDSILALYYAKYGIAGLYFKTPTEMAKSIGVTCASLQMQASNFRYALGDDTALDVGYSAKKEEIFEKYGKISALKFRTLVKDIIGQTKMERDEALIKLGKDPSKFKKI